MMIKQNCHKLRLKFLNIQTLKNKPEARLKSSIAQRAITVAV